MKQLIQESPKKSKKKIFHEQGGNKTFTTANGNDNKVCKSFVQSNNSSNIIQTDEIKKQIEELHKNNQELKQLLKEQRERYDSLFEEYQELMERNSLIEKEYINLKYEHNKELKDMKKQFSQQLQQKIQTIVNEFRASIKAQEMSEIIKGKVQGLLDKIQELRRLSIVSKKHNKNHSKQVLDACEEAPKSKITSQNFTSSVKMPLPPQQIDSLPITQKEEKHVQPQPVPSFSTIEQQEVFEKQFVFEDQYYGELQDYNSFEEKVSFRRNYELMKKHNRNSADVKRKKIFNPNIGS